MAKWIKPSRVRSAIGGLAEWRMSAKSQPAMHLWPLLALIEKGANSSDWTEFTESDDYDFWDRYGRLPDEERSRHAVGGEHTPDYYIEPLLKSKKPGDYPHRSPNTIRTRTFLNSWKAAEIDDHNPTLWRLSPKYADIFVAKVLRRDGVNYRVPVVDLAAWLFRGDEFENNADAKALERRFRETFPFADRDYDKLFEFVDEKAASIFTSKHPSNADYETAIEEALTAENEPLPTPPPLYGKGPDSPSPLDDDDPILRQVQELLTIGTSGIIFRGCPGTSKTWYAKQIARHLTSEPAHIFQAQFHPSYGYEDFVEGYRPDENSKSGFKVTEKVFLQACGVAATVTTPVVFIIDEINRGDPARIFGELLTYIEFGYRGDAFMRAYSGTQTTIPANLIILGTMNQADKSITQLDLALMRRFDHIDLKPSAELVEAFLQRSEEFSPEQVECVSKWFETLQRFLPIGHTYFKDVRTPEHVRTIWHYRMLPYCEVALELEPQDLENVRKAFDAMYKRLVGQAESEE